MRSLVALGTGMMMVAVGGCSAGGEAASEEPPIVEVSVDDMRTFTLPLDPYLDAGGPDFGTESQAYVILFVRCMSRFGFELEVPTPSQQDRSGPRERWYGLTDINHAHQYGYKFAPNNSSSNVPSVPQSDTYAAIASGNAPDRIHNGVEIPEGGCAGEARRTLDEGAPRVEDPSLGRTLALTASHLAEQDSRVVAVFQAWSECMAGSGYSYADPWEVNDDPAFTEPEVTPAEIAVATADVTCKIEVNLVNTWAGVETAYQLRLLEENAEALQELLEMLEVRRRNAVEIVEG